MRIAVCVKQISHAYARTGIDPERDFLAPEDEVFRVNPYGTNRSGKARPHQDAHRESETQVCLEADRYPGTGVQKPLSRIDEVLWFSKGKQVLIEEIHSSPARQPFSGCDRPVVLTLYTLHLPNLLPLLTFL